MKNSDCHCKYIFFVKFQRDKILKYFHSSKYPLFNTNGITFENFIDSLNSTKSSIINNHIVTLS